MAANAAALAEKVFPLAKRPADIVDDQHHVRGVTGLAAGFDISFREERPKPVLIGAVGFLDAGRCAAIALMAGGTAKFFGIVDLQEFGIAMARKGPRVLVRLLA